jgi:hypothetical protein
MLFSFIGAVFIARGIQLSLALLPEKIVAVLCVTMILSIFTLRNVIHHFSCTEPTHSSLLPSLQPRHSYRDARSHLESVLVGQLIS